MTLNLKPKKTDFILIFITRALRMFSYGMIAVIFIQNLIAKSFMPEQIGFIQSAIVFGDIGISLILTTKADIFGRKKTLMIGSILVMITGIAYANFNSLSVLIVSGIVGVISVTGGQIGPFLPIQQSALTQIIQDCSQSDEHVPKNISKIFGYYNMVGYIAQACGAAFAGFYVSYVRQNYKITQLMATNNLIQLYALLGLLMGIGYFLLNSESVQPKVKKQKQILNFAGIQKKNCSTIVILSLLFSLDSWAGAFIVQSFLSYYFQQKFSLNFNKIGGLLFVCNIISGISGILSSKIVDRIGALATMIFTHLPSNVFLLFIPFAPNSEVAMILLVCRFCISQMDVPARQTYVSLMVSSGQRSAANGITNIARSVGLTMGLALNGLFFDSEPSSLTFSLPFIIAGGTKIVYDITLGCCFLWNKKKKEHQQQKQFQLQEQQVPQDSSTNNSNIMSQDLASNQKQNK